MTRVVDDAFKTSDFDVVRFWNRDFDLGVGAKLLNRDFTHAAGVDALHNRFFKPVHVLVGNDVVPGFFVRRNRVHEDRSASQIDAKVDSVF